MRIDVEYKNGNGFTVRTEQFSGAENADAAFEYHNAGNYLRRTEDLNLTIVYKSLKEQAPVRYAVLGQSDFDRVATIRIDGSVKYDAEFENGEIV